MLGRPGDMPGRKVANLEAEVERLRAERATDADETAGMLVRIVESDRMRSAAQVIAVEAKERAGALQADLNRAMQRIESLERQLDELEHEVRAMRGTISGACGMLEDLQRREEIAASLRTRSVRDLLSTLANAAGAIGGSNEGGDQGGGAASGHGPAGSTPESSVEIVGTHEWDLDMAE